MPSFTAASPAAFWIWRNEQGLWVLRTTTGNALRQFNGYASIQADGLRNLKITRSELSDTVSVKAHVIYFHFATQGQVEGLDIETIKKTSCVRFFVDLKHYGVTDLFVGKNAIRVTSGHVVLCPKT